MLNIKLFTRPHHHEFLKTIFGARTATAISAISSLYHTQRTMEVKKLFLPSVHDIISILQITDSRNSF
jgi:hypothetical protein